MTKSNEIIWRSINSTFYHRNLNKMVNLSTQTIVLKDNGYTEDTSI